MQVGLARRDKSGYAFGVATCHDIDAVEHFVHVRGTRRS